MFLMFGYVYGVSLTAYATLYREHNADSIQSIEGEAGINALKLFYLSKLVRF